MWNKVNIGACFSHPHLLPIFQQHFGYWIKDHTIFKLFCVIHQRAISVSSFDFNCTLSTSEFLKLYLPVTFQQVGVIMHPTFLFSSICCTLRPVTPLCQYGLTSGEFVSNCIYLKVLLRILVNLFFLFFSKLSVKTQTPQTVRS